MPRFRVSGFFSCHWAAIRAMPTCTGTSLAYRLVRQQFHAVMAENGILEVTPERQAALAARIRSALQAQIKCRPFGPGQQAANGMVRPCSSPPANNAEMEQ